MPDFPIVPHALVTPTRCLFCQTTACREGFLDSLVELEGYGRIYMCLGCLSQAATRAGFMEPRVVAELRGALAAKDEMIGGLQAALEFERAHKLIARDDLQAFVGVQDPLKCPDCGGPKTAVSKRCRTCANRVMAEAAA